jgi:methionyl-tRNA formyltransferase
MKIIFAGTPPFAAVALEALIGAGYQITVVLTQPDRPAGRGMKPVSSPVKLLALQHGLPLLQPTTLKQPELHSQLEAFDADVMVVAAYGLILPTPVLRIPKRGCLNIHASLLPRWRGAAPIQRAILAGDQETGITIMQMDKGLDTGAILLQRSVSIVSNETAQTLHDKLAPLGAQCIVEALKYLRLGTLTAFPQNEAAATYATKLEKEEAEISWHLSAQAVERAVRAFNPRPGARTHISRLLLKIWQARVGADSGGAPGEIIATGHDGIVVACSEGTLVLEVLQKAGGGKMRATEFLLGHPLRPGDRFECRK